MDQMELFKNYSYSMGSCAKKILQKQQHRKCKYEFTMNVIP